MSGDRQSRSGDRVSRREAQGLRVSAREQGLTDQSEAAPQLLCASGPANACAAQTADHPRKMVARPIFVPTRSMNVPAGICPSIMPRLKIVAMYPYCALLQPLVW